MCDSDYRLAEAASHCFSNDVPQTNAGLLCVLHSLGTVAIAAVTPNMGYDSSNEDEEGKTGLPHVLPHKKGAKADVAQERVLRLVSWCPPCLCSADRCCCKDGMLLISSPTCRLFSCLRHPDFSCAF